LKVKTMHEFYARVLNKLVKRQDFNFFISFLFEQWGCMSSEGGIADDAYGLFLLFLNFFQISSICTTINVDAIRDI
jgi:hypothetical protein